MDNQTQDIVEIENEYLDLTSEIEVENLGSPTNLLHNDDFKRGESLYLSNGEYEYESGSCILNDVSVIGEECEKTRINFNNLSIVANDVIFRNLTIIGANFKNQGNFLAENVLFKDGQGKWADEYSNSYGGVIYTSYSSVHIPHTISLKNCTFIGNTAEYGGVIYINNGNLEIENCLFLNNYAIQYGGAIAIEKANKVTIKKSSFINDSSLYDAGGAIYILDSSLDADNLTICNCSALLGGAVAGLNSNVNLNHISSNANIAKYDGGAVFQMYGKILITNSNFKGNHARNGGALFLDNTSSIIISNNDLTNNVASNAGAIYAVFNSKIQIENNTCDENDTYFASALTQVIKDLNYIQFGQQIQNIAKLPSYYNLADEGFTTPAKDQEDSGICWAFSIIAALESSILKVSNVTYDLSEGNVKNLMAFYSDYGWNKKVNRGGTDNMAIGYLTGWLGPVLESEDLTDTKDVISPLISPLTHIQNVVFIDRENYLDNNGIKEAILKYGGVVTAMYYTSSCLKGSSYYYSGSEYTDHSVVIVGWDDNYSKYNFGDIPIGNGAFIVKNSWGEEWGDNGYFYVSYYDSRLASNEDGDVTYAFPLTNGIKYEKNYQYDIQGKTHYLTAPKVAWYENVFTATEDEYLAAVSTYFSTQSSWDVFVYVNDTLKATKSGNSGAGYYTIPLGDLIQLHRGDVFKVVFKISNRFVDVPVSKSNSLNRLSYTKGVSFISFNGNTWMDLYDYDSQPQVACIKAFTISNKLNSTVKLDIVEKGLNSIKIDATITDSYDNQLNSGKVLFYVDNQIVEIEVVNGIACLDHSFENQGNHEVTAEFIADNYNPSNATINFSMGGILKFNVTDIIYGEKIIITPNLTDFNGVKLADKLNLTISNMSYVIDNSEFIVPDLFDAGEYEAILSIDSLQEIRPFTISKKESKISINVSNMTGKVLINVLVNDKVSEDVLVNVDGRNYTVDWTGSILISNLGGSYTVVVYWLGDKNHDACENSEKFKVFLDPELSIGVEDVYIGQTAVVKILINENITGKVFVRVAGRNYTVDKSDNVSISNLDSGEYDVVAYYGGDEYFIKSINSTKFKVNSYEVQIMQPSNFIYYGEYYSVVVKGFDGNLAQNVDVNLKIAETTLYAKTNNKGEAIFKITNLPKSYTVHISALGKTITGELTVKQILQLKKVKIKKSSKKLVLTANLKKVNGKYLKNKKITFKFNGKNYNAKTNSKGVAKVTVKSSLLKKLKVGKKITYSACYITNTVKHMAKVRK